MALKRDHIDLLCEQWARVRREVLGMRHPLNATEYIGAPRCTLAARRDLPTGARGTRKGQQNWPEVYTGDLLIVNRAFKAMSPELRVMVDLHWTVQRPRNKTIRAELAGLSPGQYWRRVGQAKEFIAGAVAMSVPEEEEN